MPRGAALPKDAPSPDAKRSERIWTLATMALFAVVPLLVFPWTMQRSGMLDGGDDAQANLPQLLHSARMFLRGELLWTPDLWMGHPLLADSELAVLYPPHLALLLGPPVAAFAIYVLCHYVVAEIAAYAYLRWLGITRLGAIFGALSYAFTGFMIGHRGHTMWLTAGAFAPLVLLLAGRATERGRARDYVLGALAFAMLPFSGALQLTIYLGGTLLLLGAVRAAIERRHQPLSGAAICVGLGLVCAAVQIVPSMALSWQLATQLRASYDQNVATSLHPALMPALYLPVGAASTEYYARLGVLSLCAVVVAVGGWRSASSTLRAWMVVLGVAFVLMLGKHVPPVARLAHELPIVGLFRIPMRHNFELGIAVSVVAAMGFDRLERGLPARLGRWVALGVTVGVLTWLAVRFGTPPGTEATAVLKTFSSLGALGASLAFALWLASLSHRTGARSRALRVALALGPALEAAWALREQPGVAHDLSAEIVSAQSALPAGAVNVRLLPPRFAKSAVGSLGGNSILYRPGAGSMLGYASIAYADAIAMFDLDMFGQPESPADLAWSSLPSVFGVTHLVLPHVVCRAVRATLEQSDAPCGDHAVEQGVGPDRRTVSCRLPRAVGAPAYHIETEVRADGSPSGVILLGLQTSRADGSELRLKGSALSTTFARKSTPLDLGGLPAVASLFAWSEGPAPVELRGAAIHEDAALSLAAIGLDGGVAASRAPAHLTLAELSPDGLRLSPAPGAIALAEVAFDWTPQRAGERYALEVEARGATDGGELVVDFWSASGFDPDDAQLVVPKQSLSSTYTLFRREIAPATPPPALLLRVFAGGTTPVEVRSARLVTGRHEIVARLRPIFVNGQGTASGDTIRFDGAARVLEPIFVPVTPIRVSVDAEARTPIAGALRFGTTPDLAQVVDPKVKPLAVRGRARVAHTALVPPDARDVSLAASVEGQGGVTIHSLSAVDACALWSYIPAAPLATGLWLYENPTALPRAYTVGDVTRVAGVAEARQALLDFDRAALGHKAVVDGVEVPPGLVPGVVESTSFSPRAVEIAVRSDAGPTLLVLNERHDPSWSAWIDGQPAPIVRTNGIVRGVFVPQGSHRVRFAFATPRSVWLGVGLSLLGLLLAAVAAPWITRRVGVVGRE